MKINKIKKLKNGKYEIVTDCYNIITYDDIIIKYNLLYKKEIDNKLLKEISEKTMYFEIYDDVLKYASKKIRCERDISDYLLKKEIDEAYVDTIIQKLKDSYVLNDRLFARAYINDKLLFSKCSITKIKNDLINNGVLVDIIDDEINNIEDYNEIERLKVIVKKRINSNCKYSTFILKNKITNEMVNLGYNIDDIHNVIDMYLDPVDDYKILLKEYNKLYIKYSKKYDNYELEKIIKSKLYSKGFKYNDIKKEDLLG